MQRTIKWLSQTGNFGEALVTPERMAEIDKMVEAVLLAPTPLQEKINQLAAADLTENEWLLCVFALGSLYATQPGGQQ